MYICIVLELAIAYYLVMDACMTLSLFQYLQNPEEKRVKFKVLFVEKSSTLTDFMSSKNISSFKSGQVFHEFSANNGGFSLLHYVEVIIIESSKVSP